MSILLGMKTLSNLRSKLTQKLLPISETPEDSKEIKKTIPKTNLSDPPTVQAIKKILSIAYIHSFQKLTIKIYKT